jgi:hypothetical protein
VFSRIKTAQTVRKWSNGLYHNRSYLAQRSTDRIRPRTIQNWRSYNPRDRHRSSAAELEVTSSRPARAMLELEEALPYAIARYQAAPQIGRQYRSRGASDASTPYSGIKTILTEPLATDRRNCSFIYCRFLEERAVCEAPMLHLGLVPKPVKACFSQSAFERSNGCGGFISERRADGRRPFRSSARPLVFVFTLLSFCEYRELVSEAYNSGLTKRALSFLLPHSRGTCIAR